MWADVTPVNCTHIDINVKHYFQGSCMTKENYWQNNDLLYELLPQRGSLNSVASRHSTIFSSNSVCCYSGIRFRASEFVRTNFKYVWNLLRFSQSNILRTIIRISQRIPAWFRAFWRIITFKRSFLKEFELCSWSAFESPIFVVWVLHGHRSTHESSISKYVKMIRRFIETIRTMLLQITIRNNKNQFVQQNCLKMQVAFLQTSNSPSRRVCLQEAFSIFQ